MRKFLGIFAFHVVVFICMMQCDVGSVYGQNCDEYSSGDNLWAPSCTEDNYYEAVQCKGEKLNGRCFCYSAEGSRIFGWDWWATAENMTCGLLETHDQRIWIQRPKIRTACSRRRAALEDAGRTDVTLHCASNGNYEELQCDNGVCWCVEPKTGEPTQRAYPESMMTYLPCYNETVVGSQYLRQCESKLWARAQVLAKLETHGRFYTHIDSVYCDADGSYGNYKLSGTVLYCVWKNNTQIKEYQTMVSGILTTNCNCARDVVTFDEDDLTFSLSCQSNGNYAPEQTSNGYPYCVDSDGYATTLLGEFGAELECTAS